MRGLGYNNDDAQALAALVPQHRGATYTLKECLEGDEEKGFEPVPGFKDRLDVYPGLFESVQKIEGLPTNSSIHASALYVFNNSYLAQNSLMRAPNKTKMTAFNMHDSDDMGALKMDVLRTDAQSKMAKCLDLLLKDRQIEWQGSLRATYDKYIHPDVLDYTNPIMWERAAKGEIANLFQFETQVGSVCIKKARPVNVMQLAEINSIMRLQVEGNEQPIDRYVRFRNDINQWYLEMFDCGLNKSEITILEKYLSGSNGVSGSQETLMLLVMDPNISNFTLGEANGFRKAVAKKKPKDIQANKEKYFNNGAKLGTRQVFLDYVWKYCVEPQLGYAFSLNHTLPYSVIAVQEMNLAQRWNPLYWQCACLCVNAGNYVGDMSEDNSDDDIEEVEIISEESDIQEEDTKTKRVAPNYGKIAKAIADAQLSGVNIGLPNINTSQIDFIPDTEHNAILYSLQAINIVSDDLLDRILDNRPYIDILDFYNRVEPTQAQMIGLIKAGCFDELCGKPRKAIMTTFLNYLADQEIDLKDKLTTVQLKKAIEMKMTELIEYRDHIRAYKFKQYIDGNCYEKDTRRYKLTDEACIKFFNTYIASMLNLVKDEYSYIGNDVIVKGTAMKNVLDKLIQPVMTYLNSLEGRQAYQRLLQNDFVNKLTEKYCSGSISKWEFDTMSFYQNGHELQHVNNSMYNIQDFYSLPEQTQDKELCAIAGTITNVNNAKHIVSLLTTTGVVDVKFYAAHYLQFNQKISKIDPVTKKKIVLDKSFFERGNKIIVYGQRRENMFTAKSCTVNNYRRIVGLIEGVHSDGSMDVRYNRIKN